MGSRRSVAEDEREQSAPAPEVDDDQVAAAERQLPLPPAWTRTAYGAPMPDVAQAVRRSRLSH
jgi:hypothetical protein